MRSSCCRSTGASTSATKCSTDDMYKMLKIIEQHADELAKLDPSFTQIGDGQMAAFQKQASNRPENLVRSTPASPNI